MAERRVLGGHALPGDVSILEYSRDALAGPLRALDRVIDQIKTGAFDPDQTRSGRWVHGEPEGEDATSEAPTEGRHLTCACGAESSVASQYRYKGAEMLQCTGCGVRRAEFDAWTPAEREA